MNILRNNDWSKIYEAHQLFINTGVIPPGAVRPQIARSWMRCRSINPWNPRPKPINDVEFTKLLNENARLVEFAKPIMEYMLATSSSMYDDNFINLSEKSGVVLTFCTRLSFPSPFKKRISESTIGTCITGMVLVEQIPFELGGPEQYSIAYHTNYGGGAPIKSANNKLIGAVLLYNNFGKIPEQPLEFIETAALLIEDLLKNPETSRQQLIETHPLFTKMLNYVNNYILIIDNYGQIINLNDKCQKLFDVDRESILKKSCEEFGINLESLISEKKYVNKDLFSVEIAHQVYSCLLQNNKTVRWLNNKEHTLLHFSIVEPPAIRPKKERSKENVFTFKKIVGKSLSHSQIVKVAKRAAMVTANVLLDGESGTGKEVFARAIHNASKRAAKPFIPINCGSIPKEILQSELFGYEEGTFTGSKKGGQIGKFQAADGGTLFLDEIGEMPLEMQVSLLRFLQDRVVTRLGQHQGKKVDVRIIAATNKELCSLVKDGKFREDLFYRLNVIHITLPSLKDRKDDILLLADYYLKYYAKLYELGEMTLAQQTQNLLYQYNWPGNVRQLENVIENAVIFSNDNVITPELLPVEILEYQPGLSSVNPETLEQQEKEVIARALIVSKGNVSEAAKSIGISRNTLYRKIDKYGLQYLR